jgi:hypothetical protein
VYKYVAFKSMGAVELAETAWQPLMAGSQVEHVNAGVCAQPFGGLVNT